MPERLVAPVIEEIDREECLELLGSLSVGRIAVARPGGPPLVVPVNYALFGDVVVFRSGVGTKLDILQEHPVSFQVDLIDPVHHTGWSVLIQGVAEMVDSDQLTYGIETWAPDPKPFVVWVKPAAITGRRIGSRSLRRRSGLPLTLGRQPVRSAHVGLDEAAARTADISLGHEAAPRPGRSD